jgi:hypothetical protein
LLVFVVCLALVYIVGLLIVTFIVEVYCFMLPISPCLCSGYNVQFSILLHVFVGRLFLFGRVQRYLAIMVLVVVSVSKLDYFRDMM